MMNVMNTAVFAAVALTATTASAHWHTPEEIRMDGVLGDRFELTVTNNYLKIPLEDFYRPFRERRLDTGFIGLGMLADAAVRFAKYSRHDEARVRKDGILEFARTQQLPDGYTGCLEPGSRIGKLWDIHEMGFFLLGFAADWQYFGVEKSLAAAKRNADYVIANWKRADIGPDAFLWDRESCLGFGQGVARLYALTGERRYRDFLDRERGLRTWDEPIVVGRDRRLRGQASGHMGTCIEQLELYGLDPYEGYAAPAKKALEFQMAGGLLITGNGGLAECWSDAQDGEGAACETCTLTYAMDMWDRMLRFGVSEPALIGDLMERAVYNALFGAQSDDGRRLRYYTPVNGVRSYWENDLYCCANNFRRAMSRIPEMVLYSRPDEIYANLYTACSAELDVGSGRVKITETTEYPDDGRIRFVIEPSEGASEFSFRLRIPGWCANPAVRVNGEAVAGVKAGTVKTIRRQWRKGDAVEADFPMAVRTVAGSKRQSGRFAVMRGPVVYALATGGIEEFKGRHPLDVQADMMLDPVRLEYAGKGRIAAVISTAEWAVGIEDVSIDGKEPENVRKVTLTPFEREANTLTYFRAPDMRRVGTGRVDRLSEMPQ